MKNLKFKIITGFRENQYYTIDGDEVHKAYYLFLHPEERTVFSNGVALIGKNIQGIEPDYNESMGWKSTHKLDSDDWNDIKKKKIDRKSWDCLTQGKEIARLAQKNPKILNQPLSEVLENTGLLEDGANISLEH